MIILDTNVVSEPLKPNANSAVMAWLDAQIAETLFLTAITVSELLIGVEILPTGKRKESLARSLKDQLLLVFGSRVLPFDLIAAQAHAKIVARTKNRGYAISMADGQIAAIAHVHGFSVATRDVEPFSAAGVGVINPWEVRSPKG